jgi:hypothetical protein
MVTAGGTFELIGNGLPIVVHIDNNVPTGITAA